MASPHLNNQLGKSRMRSICTRHGIVPVIHRCVYANGRPAAGALAVVACIAFPFTPAPSAVLVACAIFLIAVHYGADFIERLIVTLDEESSRDERMEAFRSQSTLVHREDIDRPVNETEPKTISSYDDWERLELED